MTLKKKGQTIIRQEPNRPCESCGTVKELRPYGKGGKFICFDCAMNKGELDKTQVQKMLG